MVGREGINVHQRRDGGGGEKKNDGCCISKIVGEVF